MSSDLRFRDYQLDAIASIFRVFGLQPAGPESDQIVARCSSDRAGEDSNHGWASEELADRSCDDDKPSIRTESAVDEVFQPHLW